MTPEDGGSLDVCQQRAFAESIPHTHQVKVMIFVCGVVCEEKKREERRLWVDPSGQSVPGRVSPHLEKVLKTTTEAEGNVQWNHIFFKRRWMLGTRGLA